MTTRSVSLVITSCNRFDLLEDTIRSFIEYNTYPISQYIIIEDSHNVDKLKKVLNKFPNIEFTHLFNDPQLGQMKSIDRAYSAVTSEYIFHCEDDWEFYQPGFIERSFSVLDTDEKIITVWLREQNDTNEHAIEAEKFTTSDGSLTYQIMQRNHKRREKSAPWHGFTFNPGLRRLADYKILAPISQYTGELTVSEAYFKLDFKAAILEHGSVKHIGDHRGIRYKLDKSKWAKDTSVQLRKVKANILKIFKV
ncbi:glycosyltransferase family A protein [Algibacillus agarilyticus]|uniref:glycosyltransferase family A protein n=1 Tax=Algibacillus agarilyticus TaxID=2234133 RepID=UPI000DCFEC03|nr:glycosyltransferase family A protein [Algibacillus agarilyticus]